MTQRIVAWTAIGVLGLLGSTSAVALESGFYIGAMGAQAKGDIDANDLFTDDPTLTNRVATVDDTDTAIGLVLGGQFGRWVAVETQIINLGKYSANTTFTDPFYFTTSPRGVNVQYRETGEAVSVTLSGILTIPIGEQVAIGLRGGFAVNVVESTYAIVARRANSNTLVFQEEDDNDAETSDLTATFGIGIEWDPTRHFGMRLEYQRINDVGSEDDDYDVDDEFDDEQEHGGFDVDLISLNLIGRF
jgi:opacity protein-like surface antigen